MGQLNYATAPAQSVPTSDPTDVSKKAASTEFVQNVVPPGVVFPYAGPIPPSGWLLADGSEVSRTTYARLFAAIGTTYGAGDGSTTFNLPDLRGEFIRGLDNARGVDAGRALGSAQQDDLKSHSHRFKTSSNTTSSGNSDAVHRNVMSNVNIFWNDPGSSLENTGGSETRPRNIAMNFIIKAQ